MTIERSVDQLGRLVIPIDYRKELGIESSVNMELRDGEIVITNPKKVDYKTRCEKAIDFIKEDRNWEDDTDYSRNEVVKLLTGGDE